MKFDNSMILQFDARSENEAFARACVAAFVVPLAPTLEELNDIKTAISEAVTNCIVHAYLKKGGVVTVETGLCDKTVHIAVKDEGVGIENIEEAMQPFYTTKPDEERSGMGFTVMQTFMDTLSVSRNERLGTTVTMTKRIVGEERGGA